jgi:hypothetical protein
MIQLLPGPKPSTMVFNSLITNLLNTLCAQFGPFNGSSIQFWVFLDYNHEKNIIDSGISICHNNWTIMTKQLTHVEYKTTFTTRMIDVTETAAPNVDIW